MPFRPVIISVWMVTQPAMQRIGRCCILAAVKRFFVDELRTLCAEKRRQIVLVRSYTEADL